MSGVLGHLDVAVVGKASLDYLVLGPRLPKPGMSVGGDVFHEGPGGKGANQAVAAARLGAAVALIARVGTDRRGHTVLATLRAEGVDERWVVRDAEAPTGVALCQVGNGGEKQILSAAGANARLSAADVAAAAEAIGRASVLLVQTGAPLQAIVETGRLARAAGPPPLPDPGPPQPLPPRLIPPPHLVRGHPLQR